MRSEHTSSHRFVLLCVLLSAACSDHDSSAAGGIANSASDASASGGQSFDAHLSAHDDAAAHTRVDAGALSTAEDAGQVVAQDGRAAALPREGGAAAPTCGLCTAYAAPLAQAQIAVRELDELSGLALGRKNPEILFAHNDLTRTTVYGLALDGMLRATITLDRAVATDLEDIAVGPCPEGSCLYLADIGDNAGSRREYAILRLVEPTLSNSPEPQNLTVSAERFTFVYEDGSHNAEGLMVSPTGELYVVTKGMGPSNVYRLPSVREVANNVAKKVATLAVPAASELAASAASAHPCGLGFLLRTYDKVYEFRANGSDFESAFAATPNVVATPSERQSEGISYFADGRGFVSAGEGAAAPIFAVSCQ